MQGPFQGCGFGGRGQGLSAPAEDAPVGPGISAAPQKKKKKIKIPLAFFGRLCYDASCEDTMKAGIHPDYQQTTIRCACGNVIETGSTKKDIRVEVCSKCHPFYTGKQKMVDTGGRVSRFNKKYGLDKK